MYLLVCLLSWDGMQFPCVTPVSSFPHVITTQLMHTFFLPECAHELTIAGRSCFDRVYSVRVEAVARPKQARKLTLVRSSTPTAANRSKLHSDEAGSRNDRERPLVLDAAETDAHNSFYMPAHAWSDVLVVNSSSCGCSELGPHSMTKYGM